MAYKLAVVSPIHKSGSRLVLENYRPISVLPILNKVVERILYRRLHDFFCCHQKLLYERQFGFREKCSTETAAIELSNSITPAIDGKKCASGVFMDLRKAFDLVDHNALLQVLHKYGIRGHALDPFQSFLENRRQVVKIGNSVSNETQIRSGVVQGSCLGPLLFLIFINAIGSIPISGKLFLFADDAVLINVHDSRVPSTIVNSIRSDLKLIVKFFDQRRLILNPSKTNFMLFTSPHMSVELDSTIEISQGTFISRVHSTKYLGLVVNENLTWSNHIDNLCKKLAPATGILWKLRNSLPFRSRKLVYDTLFQTHLNYMSTIWGFSPCSSLANIQVLQNRALRNVYHLPNRANRSYMFQHQVESHLPIRGIVALNTATFMFKALHNMTTTNLHFVKAGDCHERKLRNSTSLRLPSRRTVFADQAIDVSGPRVFNKVPDDIKALRSPASFRWALRCHLRNQVFIESCFNKTFFELKI